MNATDANTVKNTAAAQQNNTTATVSPPNDIEKDTRLNTTIVTIVDHIPPVPQLIGESNAYVALLMLYTFVTALAKLPFDYAKQHRHHVANAVLRDVVMLFVSAALEQSVELPIISDLNNLLDMWTNSSDNTAAARFAMARIANAVDDNIQLTSCVQQTKSLFEIAVDIVAAKCFVVVTKPGAPVERAVNVAPRTRTRRALMEFIMAHRAAHIPDSNEDGSKFVLKDCPTTRLAEIAGIPPQEIADKSNPVLEAIMKDIPTTTTVTSPGLAFVAVRVVKHRSVPEAPSEVVKAVCDVYTVDPPEKECMVLDHANLGDNERVVTFTPKSIASTKDARGVNPLLDGIDAVDDEVVITGLFPTENMPTMNATSRHPSKRKVSTKRASANEVPEHELINEKNRRTIAEAMSDFKDDETAEVTEFLLRDPKQTAICIARVELLKRIFGITDASTDDEFMGVLRDVCALCESVGDFPAVFTKIAYAAICCKTGTTAVRASTIMGIAEDIALDAVTTDCIVGLVAHAAAENATGVNPKHLDALYTTSQKFAHIPNENLVFVVPEPKAKKARKSMPASEEERAALLATSGEKIALLLFRGLCTYLYRLLAGIILGNEDKDVVVAAIKEFLHANMPGSEFSDSEIEPYVSQKAKVKKGDSPFTISTGLVNFVMMKVGPLTESSLAKDPEYIAATAAFSADHPEDNIVTLLASVTRILETVNVDTDGKSANVVKNATNTAIAEFLSDRSNLDAVVAAFASGIPDALNVSALKNVLTKVIPAAIAAADAAASNDNDDDDDAMLGAATPVLVDDPMEVDTNTAAPAAPAEEPSEAANPAPGWDADTQDAAEQFWKAYSAAELKRAIRDNLNKGDYDPAVLKGNKSKKALIKVLVDNCVAFDDEEE